MRLPEKPPKWRDVLKSKRKEVVDILSNNDLLEIVSGFNKKYLYWSEVKHQIKDVKKSEAVWTVMKMMREGKEEKLDFKKIDLKYCLLPDFSKKLHYFDQQLAGNIASQTSTIGLEEKYIISSLMEEAIASSMIEGAATTRKVAKEMLKTRRKPKDKSERMILNNYRAMEEISKRKDEPLTPKFLLEIQKIVTNETLEEKKDEGIFRDNDNIVVGDGVESDKIAHIPPKHKDVSVLIKELCVFANNDSEEFIHPIVKGITIHFLIGYIHPFNDGNGRTARSIFYWYMLSKGYWLFKYMAVSRRIVRSRARYDSAYLYTEQDELDLTYFVKYIIECIDDSLKDLFEYIDTQQKEKKEIRNIVDEKLGLNVRQIDIVKKFRQESDKFFTVREIENVYGITYATARADLLLLTDKKIVDKKKLGKQYSFILNKNK